MYKQIGSIGLLVVVLMMLFSCHYDPTDLDEQSSREDVQQASSLLDGINYHNLDLGAAFLTSSSGRLTVHEVWVDDWGLDMVVKDHVTNQITRLHSIGDLKTGLEITFDQDENIYVLTRYSLRRYHTSDGIIEEQFNLNKDIELANDAKYYYSGMVYDTANRLLLVVYYPVAENLESQENFVLRIYQDEALVADHILEIKEDGYLPGSNNHYLIKDGMLQRFIDGQLIWEYQYIK